MAKKKNTITAKQVIALMKGITQDLNKAKEALMKILEGKSLKKLLKGL